MEVFKIIVGRIHGSSGLGGAAITTVDSSIKLSELVELAVEHRRKIGKSAMSEVTLAAHEWKKHGLGPAKRTLCKVQDKWS
jgi:methylglutaconyl-CoA hydratase